MAINTIVVFVVVCVRVFAYAERTNEQMRSMQTCLRGLLDSRPDAIRLAGRRAEHNRCGRGAVLMGPSRYADCARSIGSD